MLVRLALIPLLFLVCAKYLPLAMELKQVLVVQAAMPAAVTLVSERLSVSSFVNFLRNSISRLSCSFLWSR